MGGLARGGHAPVLITFMMGTSAIIIGVTIDSINGLMHLFGVLCWMLSAFFVNFWRDPDRKIPSDEGVLVSPADGHVMFVRRERATGRRPNQEELNSDKIESDKLTGPWYPETIQNPLSFATEQRFEPVQELRPHLYGRFVIGVRDNDRHAAVVPAAVDEQKRLEEAELTNCVI